MAMFVLLAIFSLFGGTPQEPNEIKYSDFLSRLEAGEVEAITVKGEHIEGKFDDDASFTTNGPATGERFAKLLKKHKVETTYTAQDDTGVWQSLLISWLPMLLFIGLWFLLVPPAAVGRRQGDELRQVAREAALGELAARDVRRRRGHRGGQGRARGDRRVPARSEEVHAARRPHPEGRAADRPAGHRQDAARARDRGRGGRAVLLDLGLGLRRDVRRRRREPRARPVRAGQEERALHHLHRRDRRGRSPPRRRPRRRSRRARADAEPAARRDGRLRVERGRDHHRGHEPPRRARSRDAAAGPLRPPRHREPARPARPRGDPARARAPGAALARRESDGDRARHAGLLRRRPRESRERGRAARGAPRRRLRGDARLRARQGEGHDGRRAAQPDHLREGAQDHRLPRGGPRADRHARGAQRPGPQGDDHPARRSARRHA